MPTIRALEVDEKGAEHLHRHGVSLFKVLELLDDQPRLFRNKGRRSGDHKLIGLTESGRLITAIITRPNSEGISRVITGWAATTGERTLYRS